MATRPALVWLVWIAVWLATFAGIALAVVLGSRGLLRTESTWLIGSAILAAPLFTCLLTKRSWAGLKMAIYICLSSMTVGAEAGLLISGLKQPAPGDAPDWIFWFCAAILSTAWLGLKLWRFRLEGWEPQQVARAATEDKLRWLVQSTRTDLQRVHRNSVEFGVMGALMVAVGLPFMFTIVAKVLHMTWYEVAALILAIFVGGLAGGRILGRNLYSKRVESGERVVNLLTRVEAARIEAARNAENPDRG